MYLNSTFQRLRVAAKISTDYLRANCGRTVTRNRYQKHRLYTGHGSVVLYSVQSLDATYPKCVSNDGVVVHSVCSPWMAKEGLNQPLYFLLVLDIASIS